MFPSVNCGSLQDIFKHILSEEDRLIKLIDSEEDDFLKFALVAYQVSDSFLKQVNHSAWAFPMFLNQIRSHAGLAILAVARRHHVQAMFSLRQVLEAGCWAAYGLANFEQDKFMKTDPATGILSVPKLLKEKRNEWLGKNFKEGSDKIKMMKKHIDETTAHSNIIYAFQNLDPSKLIFHFFDTENEVSKNSDLYFIGLTLLHILDLFHGVNQTSKAITFSADFLPNMKILGGMVTVLKTQAQKSS